MRHATLFPILFLLVFLTSCTANSVVVNSDFDTTKNFSIYHTYQWLKHPEKATGDIRLDNSLLHSRIQQAIEQQMAHKMLSKVSSDSPDFLVNYHVAISEDFNIHTVQDVYGYQPYSMRGWGTSGTSYVEKIDQGSLLIDFIDPNTKNLIWRGTGKGMIQESLTPEEREARVSIFVEKILAQYPPTIKP